MIKLILLLTFSGLFSLYPSNDNEKSGLCIKTTAHSILDLEGAATSINPEANKLLDNIIETAVTSYCDIKKNLDRMNPRDRALKTLEFIEKHLQTFHFVYPPSGYVWTLREGLMDVSIDYNTLNRLCALPANMQRKGMIEEYHNEVFHMVDCDIFSILYMAIGEALNLPISLVDTPKHTFVSYSLPNGTYVYWEATTGIYKIVQNIIKPMSQSETIGYWHSIIGTILSNNGLYEKALEHYYISIEKGQNKLDFYNKTAWLLATCPDPKVRNPQSALLICEKMIEIYPNLSANEFDTIAAVYAALNRWPEAINMQLKAISLTDKEDPDFDLCYKRLLMYHNKHQFIAPRFLESEAQRWKTRLESESW
jgi:tetratricopeptide (TPR) repeat protein